MLYRNNLLKSKVLNQLQSMGINDPYISIEGLIFVVLSCYGHYVDAVVSLVRL